jgi:unsaturated rhamnogalacturonyl hydrolase
MMGEMNRLQAGQTTKNDGLPHGLLARILLLLTCAAQLHAASAVDAAWIPGPAASAPTVVVIGGLDGKPSEAVDKIAHQKSQFNVYTIRLANPKGEALVFPPTGTAYRENGQSHFIWRWLGLHAPDLVIVAGDQDFGLAEALAQNKVAGVGRIPAVRVAAIPRQIARSEARIELDRRLQRTPHEMAMELSKFYGHDFDPPVYIPAMALISRVRIGQQSDVETLVAPYLDGSKDSLAKPTSSHLAGHLIFADLAERTHDQRYIDRVRAAADLAFTETGEMREAMPMHTEMSDAVFMGCPILASAGALTGKPVYFDMALRHLQFMQKLCLRSDGLYRHSPLNEAAWGRGNAFPALGLSWTLLKTPENYPGYAGMVKSFQDHMHALEKFQDRDGMWHEVIDQPGSYAEFTATAMIATAMQRGVRRGWLDPSYKTRVQAAWRGILTRIGPDGVLLDVCESTGKQKSLEDYLNRAASFGKDARGGGMAMLLATELEATK